MAKIRQGYKYFTSSDLARIKRNTNRNNHIENYIFIAEKTGFPTIHFKEIKKIADKKGYNANPEVTYRIYKDLMLHVGNVTDVKEYNAVYKRL